MIVYADASARDALSVRPQLNRQATFKFATALFPKEELAPLDDGNLAYTCPPNNELHVGCFPGVSVVAAKEFGIDHPSRLPNRFLEAGGSGTITVHAMHSVVDWFTYAQWANGKLIRSLRLSPDSGILEDIGQRFPFEEPCWSGQQFMIYPYSCDERGNSLPMDTPLPLGVEIPVRMVVLNDELHTTLHCSRITEGTRSYCQEGVRRVAEGRVTCLTGLFTERSLPGSALSGS